MCGKSVGIIWFHYFSCHPSCGYNERWHDCPVRDKSDLKRCCKNDGKQLWKKFHNQKQTVDRTVCACVYASAFLTEICIGWDHTLRGIGGKLLRKSSTPEFTKTLSVWWRIPYIREESAWCAAAHIPRKNIERMSMRLIYFCLTDRMLSFSSFLLLTKVPVRFSCLYFTIWKIRDYFTAKRWARQ